MQIYYLKQVAFEIVISDTQLKTQVTAVKKALGEIKGAGVNIKLNVTKAEITALRKKVKDTLDQAAPIPLKLSGTANLVTNANSFAKGIEKAALNMEKFLKLIKESAIESATIRNNLGSSGGGRNINAGSRHGFTTTGAAQLSAFSGFIRGGQSFTSQIGAYASGIGRLGIAAAAPIALIAGLVRGLRDAVTAVTEFGDKQAQLASVLGTTRDGISSLTEQAKSLGATMSFTASEISGAQIELAKLGFTSDEVLSSTEGVARFAIVAGANIPEAAEAAGSALKSFELEATEMDRVVSVLGVSTAKSALDFEKLKVGIGTTFATAKTFGLEIEDVVTLLGELSNRGLSASVAATATRNILLNLSDANGKLRKSLTGLGVNEVKGLDGILLALRKLNGAGIDLNSTFELTDKRSINAFNSFLRSSGDLQAMKDSLVDVNDEFKIMEKERLNSLKGETILFTSAVERLNLQMGGLENVLQGALSGINGLINGFSDFLELAPGEAVAKEGDNVTNLIKSLIIANDNYALKSKLIAQLKISYPDLIKGIDLERATVGELNKLLEETTLLYEKKVNISVGETEFERAVKRENEALEKQAELLRKRQGGDAFDILVTNPLLRQRGDEVKAARDDQFIALSKQLRETSFISLDQEKRLSEIVNQSKGVRGGRISGDAVTAKSLLGTSNFLRAQVRPEIPNFTDKDFAVPTDGQLSKVQEYINKLEAQRKVFKSNSVQADELSVAIKNIEGQIEKRRKPLVDPKDKKGGKDEVDPAAGSIDALEAEYSKLVKQIDAVGDEKLRPILQKQSESFKKQIKEARDKLKADLEPTDDEKIKLFNTLVDNQRDIDSKANKERFKDERIFEAVELEQIKQAELRKIFFRGQFLKKAYDQGLDKSGEYLSAQQDFANKLVELEEATGKRVLAVGEVSREMEVKDRLAILRLIYEDEEDFAKAKESLFLELQAAKIKAAVAAGKVLTLIEEDQLNGILDKMKEINSELSKSNFTKNLDGEQGVAFNEAFNSAYADGKLSKGEIKELEDLEKKLSRERELAIANEAILQAETQSEKTAAQVAYNKLIIKHQKEEYEDKKEKQEKIWETIRKGAEIVGEISDKIFEYERAQQEAKAESELEYIDSIYEARLKAAEGNATETAKIEAEYATVKKAAEKKAAEERRQIALKEAAVNLALGVIKAIPNLVLMGVAAVAGAIQIATIKSQKFAKGGGVKRGGYTGEGYGQPDETGHIPVGIVHDGEYVIPKWQVRKSPSLIRSLESDRLRGYATGGLATAGSGGISLESFAMMADIIAVRVAESVGAAAYKGTARGSESGSASGITKVSREQISRNSAKLINTF